MRDAAFGVVGLCGLRDAFLVKGGVGPSCSVWFDAAFLVGLELDNSCDAVPRVKAWFDSSCPVRLFDALDVVHLENACLEKGGFARRPVPPNVRVPVPRKKICLGSSLFAGVEISREKVLLGWSWFA